MEKRLRRSRTSKVVAGVCGGLGEVFGWDPVLVRLGFAAGLLLVPPLAFLGYLVLWFAAPLGPPAPAAPSASSWDSSYPGTPGDGSLPVVTKPASWGPVIGGLLLVLLGISFFVPQGFFPFWGTAFHALTVVGIGLVAARILWNQVAARSLTLVPSAMAVILGTVAVYLVFAWPVWDDLRLYGRYAFYLLPAGVILTGLGLLFRRTTRPEIPAVLGMAVLVFVAVYSYWGPPLVWFPWD